MKLLCISFVEICHFILGLTFPLPTPKESREVNTLIKNSLKPWFYVWVENAYYFQILRIRRVTIEFDGLILNTFHISSIWVLTKPYLRRCCEVLPEITWPEVTWPEVTLVTWPEMTSVTCNVRKYVLRMRNRKLPISALVGSFGPEVTSVTWLEEALSGSRFCACSTGSCTISTLAGPFDRKWQSHVTGSGPVRKRSWPAVGSAHARLFS